MLERNEASKRFALADSVCAAVDSARRQKKLKVISVDIVRPPERTGSLPFPIPLDIKSGCLDRADSLLARKSHVGKQASELQQKWQRVFEIQDHIIAGEESIHPLP